MKIMLDKSPNELIQRSNRYNYDFWQLRTPLTSYALANVPYGLDNGCFKTFRKDRWRRLVTEAREVHPVFVCVPDMVFDARRTLDLFDVFESELNGLPKALVLQDGIENYAIPWKKIEAVFIGGSDTFKISPEAINAAKTAKMLDKWVHVGRVNTTLRLSQWEDLADSIDGSGISRYDHMLDAVIHYIRHETEQISMEL